MSRPLCRERKREQSGLYAISVKRSSLSLHSRRRNASVVLVFPGPPEAPRTCDVRNRTTRELTVECEPGECVTD